MAAMGPSPTSIRCGFDSHLRSSHFHQQLPRRALTPSASSKMSALPTGPNRSRRGFVRLVFRVAKGKWFSSAMSRGVPEAALKRPVNVNTRRGIGTSRGPVARP